MEAHAAVRPRRFPPRRGRGASSGDRRNLHFALGNHERMAHGNELARALGSHNASHACAGKNITLLGAIFEHHRLRLGVHEDGSLGNGEAARLGLLRHIDHAHIALLVNMGKRVAVGVARLLRGLRCSHKAPLHLAGLAQRYHSGHRASPTLSAVRSPILTRPARQCTTPRAENASILTEKQYASEINAVNRRAKRQKQARSLGRCRIIGTARPTPTRT